MPSTTQPHFDTTKLLRITCVFWLIAKIISYKVWTANRIFPIVPVFDVIEIPNWIHVALFGISLICIGFLIFRPPYKLFQYLLLLSELFSLSLDYTRWQPWEYQYLFILFIFLVNREPKNIRVAMGFLLAALYVYSGLHKLNTGFLLQIWDVMILNTLFHIPHSARINPLVFYSGYFLGALELCGGLALLLRKTQKPAAIFLLIMHVFNLLWLGPLGANYNIIIWPWNVLMCILLYFLFVKNNIGPFIPVFKRGNIIVLFTWGILPAFNFIGYWDHYLSGSLYSGKLPLMAICIGNDPKSQHELTPYRSSTDKLELCPGMSLVKVQHWALSELNVPPYPEVRVYRKIAKEIHLRYPGSTCYLYTYGNTLKKEISE